jgi:hypothetical protein
MKTNEFQVKVELPPELEAQLARRASKKAQQFIKIPLKWMVPLKGASGQTVLLALELQYLAWRRRTPIVVLTNRAVINNVSRTSKWRSLRELERRGLITMEYRGPRKPPVVQLNLVL